MDVDGATGGPGDEAADQERDRESAEDEEFRPAAVCRNVERERAQSVIGRAPADDLGDAESRDDAPERHYFLRIGLSETVHTFRADALISCPSRSDCSR